MIFTKDINQDLLNEMFVNEDKCLAFLSHLKWENGFVCKKCGNTNYCNGKSPHSRRCTKCKNEESATAGSIFHNCKFPINKAFYIAYTICKVNKELSSYEFARRLSLRQMTCWKFKDKIIKAIENSGEISENWTDIFK